MADYRILLARSAEHDLERLPRLVQDRTVRAIDSLSKTPWPPGVKKLRGSVDLWRIRVGDYRVIYRILSKQGLIDVIHIRHRKDAYA